MNYLPAFSVDFFDGFPRFPGIFTAQLVMVNDWKRYNVGWAMQIENQFPSNLSLKHGKNNSAIFSGGCDNATKLLILSYIFSKMIPDT